MVLSFGDVGLMVRAELSQDGDSVMPPSMWLSTVPSTMLLQNWDNVSLQCRNTVTHINKGSFGGKQETCKIFSTHLCQSQTVGKDQNL